MTGEIGIPYGDAIIDGEGYGVRCPACGEILRDRGASSEDRITKGAAAAYGIHWAEFHGEVRS